MLQGGDCAEMFADATADADPRQDQDAAADGRRAHVRRPLPVVKMGRMAGQFAKPRCSGTETRGDVTLPSYRGDIVNGLDFTPSRAVPTRAPRRGLPPRVGHLEPDPRVHPGWLRRPAPGARVEQGLRPREHRQRGLRAARRATSTRRSRSWTPAASTPKRSSASSSTPATRRCCSTTSCPLTRIDSRTDTPYDMSGHFVWIGERTRAARRRARRLLLEDPQPDRREARSDDHARAGASQLIDKLDPNREPGRLTFITRMGAGKIRDLLPPLVEKVATSGRDVAVGLRPDARQHASRPPTATRRVASTTWSTRCAASSRCTVRSAPTRAASTSSSPVTTSPSASAAAERIDDHTSRALRDGLRPAPEPHAGARARVPRRRDARPRSRHPLILVRLRPRGVRSWSRPRGVGRARRGTSRPARRPHPRRCAA